jgi:hypothetical protein
MTRALADPEIDAVRGELLVDGFVPLDDVDYEPILGLAPDDRSRRINR